MLEFVRGAALVAATVAVGLVAGLFFGYCCSVMPALRGADDRTFVEVMQRVNVAILNGWFAAAFGGALVTTALAAGLHVVDDGRSVLPPAAGAFVLYAGAVAVTRLRGIPLNDALAAAGPPGAVAAPGAARERFEGAWVRWNVVRTVLCTGALGCLCCALVRYGGA
ncbi:anthrone oxygenase family protein [Streptomyces sp. I05A-00742]|uniref:anthrone oxygenase family protein n=1 Tax=Streptomyces sp. I05A-00742 TaxID=2732853 RepID=UPI00289F9431|nr:anthrone oxygenase family protein [Streptomyces sp. I05A-00742]